MTSENLTSLQNELLTATGLSKNEVMKAFIAEAENLGISLTDYVKDIILNKNGERDDFIAYYGRGNQNIKEVLPSQQQANSAPLLDKVSQFQTKAGGFLNKLDKFWKGGSPAQDPGTNSSVSSFTDPGKEINRNGLIVGLGALGTAFLLIMIARKKKNKQAQPINGLDGLEGLDGAGVTKVHMK